MPDEDTTTTALTVLVSGAAGAAATALGPEVSAPVVAGAGLLSALPPAFGWAMGFVVKKMRQRCETFWTQFVDAYQRHGGAGAALLIEARIDDPAVHESVVEAFRRLSQAHDDVAVAPLALLTAEYAATGKRPDRFMRGLGALLADITSSEYVELVRMVAEVADRETPHDTVELHAMRYGGGDTHLCVVIGHTGRVDDDYIRLGIYSELTTIFTLFKRYDLASGGAAGFLGSTSGPHVMLVGRATLRRIQSYVGEAPG